MCYIQCHECNRKTAMPLEMGEWHQWIVEDWEIRHNFQWACSIFVSMSQREVWQILTNLCDTCLDNPDLEHTIN